MTLAYSDIPAASAIAMPYPIARPPASRAPWNKPYKITVTLTKSISKPPVSKNQATRS